jgi:hypothetical protein
MVKTKCSEGDDEWKVRQQTRREEIAAVNDALQVLANDDAHDLFTKTYNPPGKAGDDSKLNYNPPTKGGRFTTCQGKVEMIVNLTFRLN